MKIYQFAYGSEIYCFVETVIKFYYYFCQSANLTIKNVGEVDPHLKILFSD